MASASVPPVPDHADVSAVVLAWAALGSDESGLLLDIGAGSGADLFPLAAAGWEVHAYEPDPAAYRKLLTAVAADWSVSVNPQAVGGVSGRAPIFEHSRGVALVPHDGGPIIGDVELVPVSTVLAGFDGRVPDIVAISTNGWEGEILRAYPWPDAAPPAVIVDVDDAFTPRLGFRGVDLARFLESRGYDVFAVRRVAKSPSSALQRVGRPTDPEGAIGKLLALRPGMTHLETLEHSRRSVLADRQHQRAVERAGLRPPSNAKQISRLRARIRQLESSVDGLERQLDDLRSSTSWRVGHRLVRTVKRLAAPWRRLARTIRRSNPIRHGSR